MNNEMIEVSTNAGSYLYAAGKGLLRSKFREIIASHGNERLFLLMDENVQRFHGPRIESLLKESTGQLFTLTVPQGEASKSIPFWTQVVDFLISNGVRRNTPVLVIGGGVTGDVGGFAAASVLRGVPLYHFPTTLLAMVDSSIGGKTGINHKKGKNLIGAFYQPNGVFADIDFLETLPRNEWVNGLSEILKYGAIRDNGIFSETAFFLETEQPLFEHDHEKLISLIRKCAKVKIDIVEEDERENGVRAFLNFGHTFAHALEKECGYSEMSHGEAVYLGMLAAQKLSLLSGGNAEGDRLRKYSGLYSFRVKKDTLSYSSLLKHMQADKKNTGREIRFVLLDSWQHPVLKSVKNESHLKAAWDVIFERLK